MRATTDGISARRGPGFRGRRLLLVLAAVVAAALAAAGAGRLLRPSPPRREPPAVALDGAEPGVARAVEAWLARVRAEPQSGRAWGGLGIVLTAHNYRAEANPCFAEAERLDPREPSWPYLHAVTLLAVDPADETAVGLLGRAADLCGAEPDAPRLRLAEVLLRQGRADEAERHFRLLLEGDPRHPPAHLGLARLAAARGEWPGALAHLQDCTGSAFTRKAALRLAAEARQRTGDPEAARAVLRQAEAAPEDAPWPDAFLEEVQEAQADQASRRQLAMRRRREGRTEEAEAAIQEVREDQPALAALLDADDLLKRGNNAEAERALREVVREAPDCAEAHYRLGVALLRREQSGAADCFRRALQLQPDYAAAYDGLGQALAREGDRAGAIEALEAAVRYRPQEAEWQCRLGELLAADGRDAEALEHFRHALYSEPDNRQAKTGMEQLGRRVHSP